MRVRLVPPGAKPAGGGSYRTVHLPAVNQPSSVLRQMLEEQGLHVLDIAEVAVVCRACGHAADGLSHTDC
ncbi:hypothetical protein GS448_25910 [Rhodococcus hoagii]|nr:hypothetical protein [Prescottella equi]